MLIHSVAVSRACAVAISYPGLLLFFFHLGAANNTNKWCDVCLLHFQSADVHFEINHVVRSAAWSAYRVRKRRNASSRLSLDWKREQYFAWKEKFRERRADGSRPLYESARPRTVLFHTAPLQWSACSSLCRPTRTFPLRERASDAIVNARSMWPFTTRGKKWTYFYWGSRRISPNRDTHCALLLLTCY